MGNSDTRRSWLMIMALSSCLFVSIVGGSETYNPESLEDFIHDYANRAIRKPRTGSLYNVPLPANFSGMEASFVRLRSGSLWARGANFSFLRIPPRVIPMPYTKRLALVYQNIGNWSSYYYNVPNYTLVGPVLGFTAFDASDLRTVGNQKLTFSIIGDPVLVRFPPLLLEDKNATLKCVKFGAGGSVEFSDITKPNVCIAMGPGHFGIVAPPPPPASEKGRFWKWWVIGIGVGFGGLILFFSVVVVIVKTVRRRKIKAMERQSEKCEAFDTTWIEGSKMPSASMIRTQPVLENDYVS